MEHIAQLLSWSSWTGCTCIREPYGRSGMDGANRRMQVGQWGSSNEVTSFGDIHLIRTEQTSIHTSFVYGINN